MARMIRENNRRRRSVWFIGAMWAALGVGGSVMAAEPRAAKWWGWLDSPGGALWFDFALHGGGSTWGATITNGSHKIGVPVVTVDGNTLTAGFNHYDSWIEAQVSHDGMMLDGEWKKKGRGDKWTVMPFHAVAEAPPKPKPDVDSRFRCGTSRIKYPPPVDDRVSAIHGRWRVDFSSSEQSAVGLFDCCDPDGIKATFLTVGGDYGHLHGKLVGDVFEFTSFDGGHAFLFKARLQDDGTLKGDFWSGPTWHETWTAERDDMAKLPSAFSLTKATGRVDLAALHFPDVDGKVRSLAEFKGEAIVIEVFGSWCPNCHDASTVLMELHKKYADRGLSMVGLAFELTGEFERDARQVRTYVKRHGITYPVLLAGIADKETVAKVLPFLEKFNAYPTTIFLDGEGNVRAIHTGFSGPATGQEYHSLKLAFENKIGELLTEKKHAEREKRTEPE